MVDDSDATPGLNLNVRLDLMRIGAGLVGTMAYAAYAGIPMSDPVLFVVPLATTVIWPESFLWGSQLTGKETFLKTPKMAGIAWMVNVHLFMGAAGAGAALLMGSSTMEAVGLAVACSVAQVIQIVKFKGDDQEGF